MAEAPSVSDQSADCPSPSVSASEPATDAAGELASDATDELLSDTSGELGVGELASDAAGELAMDTTGLDVTRSASMLCVEREEREERADRVDRAGDGGHDTTSSSSRRRASWIAMANDHPVDMSSSGGNESNSRPDRSVGIAVVPGMVLVRGLAVRRRWGLVQSLHPHGASSRAR